MANIGEIVKEVEVVPVEAPVESPQPAEEPVHVDTPDRELIPAG